MPEPVCCKTQGRIGEERYIHDQPKAIFQDTSGVWIPEFRSPDMKRISGEFGTPEMRTWKFSGVIFEYRPT
jgi:hypothetical protein